MGCGCDKVNRDRYTVTLPGGTNITKFGKAAADAFAAKHPGSKVNKKT